SYFCHRGMPASVRSQSLPSHTSFFNPTPPTEISTLSLHDALPIWDASTALAGARARLDAGVGPARGHLPAMAGQQVLGRRHAERSEEHTSELQSRGHLVCRLLLEKKKKHNHCHQCLNATPYHRNTL